MSILLFTSIVLMEIALSVWAFLRAKCLERTWLWRSTLIAVVLCVIAGVHRFAMGPNPLTSSGVQAFGNPIVCFVLEWETDRWTGFGIPPPFTYVVIAVNHLFLAGIGIAPFILAQAITLGRHKLTDKNAANQRFEAIVNPLRGFTQPQP